jgi:hypothetical protein
MKTKQTKIDRSAAKWLPGAMALAATTASSQAATVQITLTGNKISSTGGNQLVADITGDLVADFQVISTVAGTNLVSVVLNPGGRAYAGVGNGFIRGDAQFGDGGAVSDINFFGRVVATSYLNPITFTDHRINNNTPTAGWLQVNAFNTSATDHTVEFSRLIFDNASTTAPIGVQTTDGAYPAFVAAVPEPGSNLALLALGAGGLTLRRRLKRAA